MEKVLASTFQGKLIHQMISKECPHTSEREEPFYKLSLVVKNKRTVQEALEMYVEGDILDGDNKYTSFHGITQHNGSIMTESHSINLLQVHVRPVPEEGDGDQACCPA
jgi:ubiquitin C-terminal hydrolase